MLGVIALGVLGIIALGMLGIIAFGMLGTIVWHVIDMWAMPPGGCSQVARGLFAIQMDCSQSLHVEFSKQEVHVCTFGGMPFGIWVVTPMRCEL